MDLASTVGSEVAGIVIELRDEAKELNRIADFLEKEIVANFADATCDEPQATLALEDVRAVLTDISRAGKTKAVRVKLDELGAAKLSEVEPAEYPALMEWAKEISDGS